MAAFPNLNSDAGLIKLNEHLLTRSYITGYQASKDDIIVFSALSKPPTSLNCERISLVQPHRCPLGLLTGDSAINKDAQILIMTKSAMSLSSGFHDCLGRRLGPRLLGRIDDSEGMHNIFTTLITRRCNKFGQKNVKVPLFGNVFILSLMVLLFCFVVAVV